MGALKDLNILPYIHKHKTKIFMETGLGFGTGVMRAMSPEFGFEAIVSIELDKEIVQHLSKTFRFDNRIRLFNEESSAGLKRILPAFKSGYPIFFFLDAHFLRSDVVPLTGPMTSHSDGYVDIRLPVWEEMKVIKELRIDKGEKDVIVIDDIMLYDNRDIYDDRVSRLEPGSCPDEQRKYLDKILDLTSASHKSKLIKEAQGTLILEPKINSNEQ